MYINIYIYKYMYKNINTCICIYIQIGRVYMHIKRAQHKVLDAPRDACRSPESARGWWRGIHECCMHIGCTRYQILYANFICIYMTCPIQTALRAGSNHLFQILDLNWRSPEFGGVWCGGGGSILYTCRTCPVHTVGRAGIHVGHATLNPKPLEW